MTEAFGSVSDDIETVKASNVKESRVVRRVTVRSFDAVRESRIGFWGSQAPTCVILTVFGVFRALYLAIFDLPMCSHSCIAVCCSALTALKTTTNGGGNIVSP